MFFKRHVAGCRKALPQSPTYSWIGSVQVATASRTDPLQVQILLLRQRHKGMSCSVRFGGVRFSHFVANLEHVEEKR